jgi:hypothetical protein
MEKLLRDRKLYEWLERVDADLAAKVHSEGCPDCGAKLHRGDYKRKPRGGIAEVMEGWLNRLSFCCSQKGCRKRKTPPSVRFLGRKVYLGVIVVLATAMMHGLSAKRVERLRETVGMDRRTLQRWREWWTETFVKGSFWKAERCAFHRRINEAIMPLSLMETFAAHRREGMTKLLEFLSPITILKRRGVVDM